MSSSSRQKGRDKLPGFYFFAAAQKSKQKTSPAHWAPSPSGEGKEENRIVFSAAVDKKLKT